MVAKVSSEPATCDFRCYNRRARLAQIFFTRTTGFAIVSPKNRSVRVYCCVCVCTKRIYTRRRRRSNQIISEKQKSVNPEYWAARRCEIYEFRQSKRKSCAKIWNDIVLSVKLVYEKGKNRSVYQFMHVKHPSAEIVLETKKKNVTW